MSKQVNFYMTAEDEATFVEFVRSDRDVGVFMYAVPSDEIPLLDVLPNRGEPFWGDLWLWDREHSPRPKMDYIPTQRYYIPDCSASEIIEFSRSYMDADRLVRGRIWAEMATWRLEEEPPVLLVKSDSFQRWFDHLARWIKRQSWRRNEIEYVMPGAAEFVKNGGTLVQAVFRNGRSV